MMDGDGKLPPIYFEQEIAGHRLSSGQNTYYQAYYYYYVEKILNVIFQKFQHPLLVLAFCICVSSNSTRLLEQLINTDCRKRTYFPSAGKRKDGDNSNNLKHFNGL